MDVMTKSNTMRVAYVGIPNPYGVTRGRTYIDP